MSATALRHPETDEELAVPAVSPTTHLSDNDLEWRTVAPYVETFTGAVPASERASSRSRSRRHKPFVLSGAVLAGALVVVELMGLVWIYALDLSALRQEGRIDHQIREVQLQKALTDNKLASYKSSPLLTKWAAELGYRPIVNDFDDVTSNAPLPAPAKKEETP